MVCRFLALIGKDDELSPVAETAAFFRRIHFIFWSALPTSENGTPRQLCPKWRPARNVKLILGISCTNFLLVHNRRDDDMIPTFHTLSEFYVNCPSIIVSVNAKVISVQPSVDGNARLLGYPNSIFFILPIV